MATIEIDFEVFKALTAQRSSESETYNDVLRKKLGLPPRQSESRRDSTGGDWITKGVRFPAGTEFRAKYKGTVYVAKVDKGALVLNGERHESPSSAAGAITKTFVNGWIFWECRFPGELEWKLIKTVRGSKGQ